MQCLFGRAIKQQAKLHSRFSLEKKVKVVGYAPTPHKFCPLTHYGDLFDGKARQCRRLQRSQGLVKKLD